MPGKTDGIEFNIDLDTRNLRAELNELSSLGQRFGQTMVRSFAGSITSGRRFSTVLKSLALSLSRQALSAAIKPLGNLLGGLFANADGNAFTQGRVSAFANGGIVNSPTLFPMRNGTGLMGEAGPEAVMPLTRGRDGKLGVRAEGKSAINITMNISTPDVTGFQKSQTQIAAGMSRLIERGNRNL